MEKILVSKYQRRIFYIISLSLLAIIELIRVFIIPIIFNTKRLGLDAILNLILDNLFATGFVTIAIASLVFWLTPSVENEPKLETVEPRRIGELLRRARDTNEYWFSGNSARYTRAVTLPELAESSRTENVSKSITMLLLNPTDKQLCEEYIKYRSGVRSANKNGEWTVERIRKDIYASIIAAYAYAAEHPLLEIKIGLKKTFSLLRVDLGKNLVVLTKEDKQDPGLFAEAGSFHYSVYREELKFSLKQSNILPVHSVQGIPFSNLNKDNVKKFLDDLGIYEASISDQDFEEIIELAKDRENPYG
ncbi:hypothetical protein [Cytobacillus oceanisediminis]|uniref:hypothetical protein n=1 Tax=Cytobacillus oceanisediminis TaxID=665099 RepID=UPI001C21AC8B|nr:hypothetical protein [Cytobacillus oceanisediminis]MBU8768269.1 hypothetical protein [Cytobacillus oceanisediminis]